MGLPQKLCLHGIPYWRDVWEYSPLEVFLYLFVAERYNDVLGAHWRKSRESFEEESKSVKKTILGFILRIRATLLASVSISYLLSLCVDRSNVS